MPRYQYEAIADEIRQRIREGVYAPGSQLPRRRELREEFSVSDIVINSAMRLLRQEGLVVTLNGVAACVVEELPPAPG